MKVTLKPLKGDNFEVEAEESTKVEDLKKIIAAAKEEMPAEAQKLIHSGKILKDEQTIAEVGYKEGEFLVVMLAKVKAPAPKAAPAPAAAAAPAAAPPASGGADTAGAAAANLVTGAEAEGTISMLCDMGFPREEAQKALAAAFGNPDRAVEYLTNGIPENLQNQGAPPAAGGGGGGGGGAAPAPAAAGGGGGGGGGSPFPPMSGGAFPAMGAPGGGAAALPPALQELRNHPQFNLLAAQVAQNPQMLAQMLPVLAQSNPELMQVIQQNPEAFMRMIQEAVSGGGGGQETDPVAAMLNAAGVGGGGGGGGGGAPPGSVRVQLGPDERAAVERLCQLGFDQNQAIQAYLACEKNEEMAANLLFDQGADAMED